MTHATRAASRGPFLGVVWSPASPLSQEQAQDALLGSLRPEERGLAESRLHKTTGLVVIADDWLGQGNATRTTPGCAASGFPHIATAPEVCAPQSPAHLLASVLTRSGHRGLETVDGPFVLAFSDGERTILAPDRFGVRQLYALRQDGCIWFADRMHPLRRLARSPSVRAGAFIEWLHYGAPLDPLYFFREIEAIPPGHALSVELRSNEVSLKRSYDLLDCVSVEAHDALIHRSDRALESELEQRIRTGLQNYYHGLDRVSLLFSGGVDSSVIGALAAQDVAIDAVTIDVRDAQAASELPLARSVANHLGFELRVSPIDAQLFRDNLCESVYEMASPLIVESSVALYLAAKTSALPEGQPVLNGAGADALFAGSTNLFKFSLLRRLIGQSIPFRVEHQERWFERLRSRLGRLGIRTATSVDPGGLDLMLGARRMEYYMEYERLLGGVQHLPPGPDREIAALMLQNFGGHMKSLVMRLDPVARAAKTHMFLPFLEESLVRFALNLPLSVKLKPSRLRLRPTPKWVLKRVASRHVPPRLLFGPKAGFEMPGGRWTGPLPRSWIRDSWVASLFEIPAPALARWLERSGHSRDRMFFATMEIWGRLFDAGQRLEDVQAEWLDASDESEKAAVSRTTPAGVRSASGLVR